MNKENNIIDLEWLEYAKKLCERGPDIGQPSDNQFNSSL